MVVRNRLLYSTSHLICYIDKDSMKSLDAVQRYVIAVRLCSIRNTSQQGRRNYKTPASVQLWPDYKSCMLYLFLHSGFLLQFPIGKDLTLHYYQTLPGILPSPAYLSVRGCKPQQSYCLYQRNTNITPETNRFEPCRKSQNISINSFKKEIVNQLIKTYNASISYKPDSTSF